MMQQNGVGGWTVDGWPMVGTHADSDDQFPVVVKAGRLVILYYYAKIEWVDEWPPLTGESETDATSDTTSEDDPNEAF